MSSESKVSVEEQLRMIWEEIISIIQRLSSREISKLLTRVQDLEAAMKTVHGRLNFTDRCITRLRAELVEKRILEGD